MFFGASQNGIFEMHIFKSPFSVHECIFLELHAQFWKIKNESKSTELPTLVSIFIFMEVQP